MKEMRPQDLFSIYLKMEHAVSLEHNLFKPASFEEGRESVVGHCNGIPMAERWEAETPLFARMILSHLEPGDTKILDYGVGVGRLAKEVINQNKEVKVIGVDDSSDQRRYSKLYVGEDRFEAIAPTQLNETVDLAYCVYVLQHVPAISIREVLYRIHYFLKPQGKLVYCSSDYRMAIRFDHLGFFDDRFLGINIRAEIEKLFEPIGPLFSDKEFKENEVVRKMVIGDDGNGGGLPHPAIVYRRRELAVPYFNAQGSSAK